MDQNTIALFILTELILTGSCAYFVYKFIALKRKDKRCTKKAKAKITSISRFKSTTIDATETSIEIEKYRPCIEYRAVGILRKAEINISSEREDAFKTGKTVHILYNPDNPDEFISVGKYSESQTRYIFGAVIFGFIALFLLVLVLLQ